MKNVSRRSFVTAGAVAALSGAAVLAGCAPHGSSSKDSKQAADGAWVGHGVGKHGDVEVEVATKDGNIERITVLKSRETTGMGDVAMQELTDLIVDNQTLDVDTVSGATLSSMAFVDAVADALDQSGAKSEEWKKRTPASLERTDSIPESADVIVVGGGGAGFAAAITAANKGKSVILLEKLGIVGGDTCLSGGEMAVPGNWIQKTAGVSDSPEQLAQDMLKGGDNVGDPALVNVIANGTLDSSEWLTFEAGVSWEHDLLFFGGHSVKRSIIPKGHTGSEMIAKLSARASKIDNITVVRSMRATELGKDASGNVTTVKAEDQLTGDTHTFTGKAVVLACGGFGSNVDMRVKYNPDMDDKILSTDSVGATGDGLTMASALGANLIDMQYIQTYPTCDPETGALLYVDDMRLESRAIMINKEGKRFVEELGRRDVLSDAIKNQTGGMAYMLWDQSAVDDTGLLDEHEDEYENLESRGIIVKADTLEEAANHFGIDADALKQTVDTWNSYCAQGSDPDFHYRDTMTPIKDGPYYINSYKPAVHYTMGGLHINTDAQVLDDAGNAIPGLYAAGEVAGHKMGTNRLGSCSRADIYTFGRIAGANAAAFGA